MSSFLSFLAVYLLGGISFLPLLFGLLFLYAYLTFPPISELKQNGDDEKTLKTGDEKLLRPLNGSADVAAGYFAVTREFVPGGVNGKPPERTSPAGSTQPANDSPSVYQTMYRSLFDRKSSAAGADTGAKKTGRRARNEFFVVLRHGHLMLYDDAEQSEVRYVISLSHYWASIYGGGEEIPEGELYIRRNAIRLSRRGTAVDRTLDAGQSATPFFLFSENCSLKEDFYFALLKTQEKSGGPPILPSPLRYDQKHILSLVQRLHSSEEHLQTNWVNGLLGRIFLAIYKTSDVERFIRTRITKKIARVNKPNFLSHIVLQKVHVGEGVPSITNPRLKEMNVDGDFCAEADLTYDGNFRLEVAAKATLQLASRFRPREVNLVLSVTLKKLEGHILIKIKPPPSNRLWIAFETMPKMELDIQPIVGSRQVIWGPVLRTIEGRIREVIAETLVLPHYDDTPFTDTMDQEFRGGIWEELATSRPPAEESAAERGSVDGVEKEDNPGDSQSQPDTPPAETTEKSMSTPTLPQVVLGTDNKKAASVIGLTENVESMPRSPSLKSSHGERKKKSNRPQSFTSMPPPSPVVGTNPVNVQAVWGKDNAVEKGSAASAVMAMSRSRSSSSPNSPSAGSHPVGGSPPGSKTSEFPAEVANDQRSEKSSRSSLYSQPETDEPLPAPPLQVGDKDAPRPSTPIDSASNSPTPSLISRTVTSVSSSIPIPNSRLNQTTPEKASVATVGALTSAVRNWYKSRNVSGEPSTEFSSVQHSRNLPPSEIPLPPAKKTAPINVPKRKTLPPPLAPTRNNTKRQVPPPPVPPRKPGIAVSDELMVVAAPDSEPTTPSSTDVGYEGSYMERGGNESLGSNLMFLGNESSSPSPSVSPKRPDTPKRRSTSPKLEEGSSSSEKGRESPSKRVVEEIEQLRTAEEAESGAKTPWEPDGALA